MIRQSPRFFVVLLAAILPSGPHAEAQTNVGPGEQRFNQGVYKASPKENDADVIDAYNCWFIQFTIGTDGFNIWTKAFCEDRQPLLLELEDLHDSIDASRRVTVVYLKLWTTTIEECWTDWSAPENYRPDIQSLCENAFGATHIYTSQEFKNDDASSWPSYQELVRRGRNWIIVLDEELTVYADDDFFFGMARRGVPDGPPATFEPNSVLIYSGHYDLADWTTFPNRWLYYSHFINAASCGDPDHDDQNTFVGDINRGNNFIGTFCINEEYTMGPPIHSPAPVHVVRALAPTAQYGTIYRPFRAEDGLLAAIERASPRVPILIEPATYDFPDGTVFDHRAVLTTSGGIVRLQ